MTSVKSLLHVSPEDLSAMIAGELDAEDLDAVAVHVASCAECQEQMVAAGRWRQVAVRRRARNVLAAAAAVVSVLWLGAMAGVGPASEEPATLSVTPPSQERSLSPADSLADNSGGRVTRVEANAMLGHVSVLAMFLGDVQPAVVGRAVELGEALREGVTVLRDGDAGAAGDVLRPFAVETEPRGTVALGLALWADGDVDEADAIEVLAAGVAANRGRERENSIVHVARWFLGKSAFGRGDRSVARLHWTSVAANEGGTFAGMAETALAALPAQ